MAKIDQDSAIPVYYQISLDLRRRIGSQQWRTGDQLPPEPELALEYGVSRMTLRQALAGLVKDGVLVRQRGRGTFISDNPYPLIHTLSFPVSFALRFKQMGYSPSSHVLKAETIEVPSSEIAQNLGIAEDTRVASFRRILLVNDQPMAINCSLVPDNLCPGITSSDLVDNSIAVTLAERYDLVPTHTENWLEIGVASEEEAALLDTELGKPLLLLTTLTHLGDGTPVEYSMTSWVGDRIRLHVQVDVPGG